MGSDINYMYSPQTRKDSIMVRTGEYRRMGSPTRFGLVTALVLNIIVVCVRVCVCVHV